MAVSPSLEKITFISLFQHSDTFDMMCVGKHTNRILEIVTYFW